MEKIKSPKLKARSTWFVLGLVFAAVLLPRVIGLDRFVTIDEPEWIFQGGNYYLALGKRDFASTYRRNHPGVTTLWAGATAYLIEYPEFRGDDLDYMPTTKMENFINQNGHQPIDLLETARGALVVGTAMVLTLAFYYVWRLFGIFPAVLGLLLLAFDPFHTALTRILHHDGMLSNLLFLSILASLTYFLRGRRFVDLAVSSGAAGIAFVAKIPGTIIFPFTGLLVLALYFKGWSEEKDRTFFLKDYALPGMLWLGMAFLATIVIWPALWVSPVETLKGIFSVALGYTGKGNTNALTPIIPGLPNGLAKLELAHFYPIVYLIRSTPVTLLGLGAFIGMAVKNPAASRGVSSKEKADMGTVPTNPESHSSSQQSKGHSSFFHVNQRARTKYLGQDTLFIFWVFAGFIVLFYSLLTYSAIKYDRYLLPAFLPLDLFAGIGLAGMFSWTVDRFGQRLKPGYVYLAAGGLIAVQLIGTLNHFPYYFTYFNPLFGGTSTGLKIIDFGWGEGLDQAAAYLKDKPNPEHLTVSVPFGVGGFSFFFPGELVYPPVSVGPGMSLEDYEDYQTLDYFVQYSPCDIYTCGTNSLEAYPYEKEIWVNGILMLRIYETDAIPDEMLLEWVRAE